MTYDASDKQAAFWWWMRHRRQNLFVSQIELAAVIGVNQTLISKYEKGVNRIPESRMAEIEEALEQFERMTVK